MSIDTTSPMFLASKWPKEIRPTRKTNTYELTVKGLSYYVRQCRDEGHYP